MPKPLPDSLWAATAAPAVDCAALAGDTRADVVIVGGGFTGLSTALHAAERGLDAVVLEANEPGWGASGRNGGQVNPGWKVLPDELRQRMGRDAADAMCRTADKATRLVFELIDRFDIDCDAVQTGYIQGGVGRRGERYVKAWCEQWSEFGAPVRLLDKADVTSLVGTEIYDSGALDERGGNVQPLSYCRGLARAALSVGAKLHGDSPVESIERVGNDWVVRTAGGTVSASHVVFGTNGYTGPVWKGLARNVVPVKSVIVATQPLGDNVVATMLQEKRHVSETLRIQAYYRLDRDNRLVFGGRGGTFDAPEHFDGEHLKRLAVEMFPQMGEPDWQYCWGGYVAMTADYTPKLLELADNAYAGLGYNGRGVAMSTLMGKQLAACVAGEEPGLPLSRSKPIPLHAFRKIGVATRVAVGKMLDQLDGHW